jgi:hypothetical protein
VVRLRWVVATCRLTAGDHVRRSGRAVVLPLMASAVLLRDLRRERERERERARARASERERERESERAREREKRVCVQ